MTYNIKYILGMVAVIGIVSVSSYILGKNTTNNTNKWQTASTTENTKTETGEKTEKTPTPAIKTTEAIKTETKTTPTTSLSSGNTKGFNSYSNSSYGFSIKYPSYVKANSVFSTFHEIGNNWRLHADASNQGTNIASFLIYSIDQGIYSTGKQSYPLYFISEVRIGISKNIDKCYTKDIAYTDQKVTSININGIPFKKFSTSIINGDKYTSSESYRTIRNNNCFAIEQIKSGTSFRDSNMITSISDAQLNTYYNIGETIIKTFNFIK